jgi:hypothetical protein
MGTGLLIAALSFGAITYHTDGTAGPNVRERFTATQLVILQKLNRADLEHLARVPVLIVPDIWVVDELAYSPMPRRYPAAASYPRIVVVHQPAQVFGAYEYGTLVRWGPVSSGRRSDPTPPGSYHLNWRKQRHTSSINPNWIMNWAFNFENRAGFAFHQQELPGGPASHGCVRLLEPDARWLFDWADTWTVNPGATRVVKPGTPVLIVGRYDFDAPPPWQSLTALEHPLALPEM